MDGTNCAGRKVSLLNDHEPPNYLARLNSFAPSLRSRTSSYDSSSIGSPPTPQLVRSHSSDSSMQTPSPITPDFVFENQDPSDYSQTSFFPQQKESMYPPMQHLPGALPYPGQQAHPVFYPQQPAVEHPQAAAAQQQKGRPKKNQYPCPMAKQYNCADYFTTSGHAARHAKKHTGKKDAVCPECLKAFTRKDNMEQHRRTHQSGRAATKAGDRDTKKAKLRAQQERPKLESQASTPTLPQVNMVDPALAAPSPGIYDMPMQHGEPFGDYSQRMYPEPSAAGYEYGGLNALANAASSIPMDPVEDEEEEEQVNGRYH
ncbi:hypothetical protein IQ06DRAFT_294927 [Phaeosphaeriaceae sp. SRC1lsM3a]|nr:hypothetical protein IQ06DRAFT_294927 [Stagonospora sp. SRC1lsM3a]